MGDAVRSSVNNFSGDGRTRVMLFAVNVNAQLGEPTGALTARGEDAAGTAHPLAVEAVSGVPDFDWLTEVVIRLPDGCCSTGDLWVSVSAGGAWSNKVLIGIG
jgi:hypothetical protein